MDDLLRAVKATKDIKDDIPSQIEEGLYLGSLEAANNKTLLKSLNITHILTVASSFPPAYPNDFTYKTLDGKMLLLLINDIDPYIFYSIVTGNAKRPLYRVPDSPYRIGVQSRPNRLRYTYRIANLDRSRLCTIIVADVNIAQYFDDCFGFINEAKRTGSVLVHCFAGRSRSATVVVAYLMKTHGMRSSKALNLVKSKRSVVAPNAGFILQLQSYEKSLPGML
ncbi:putative phosphoric monoester hydrolase [Helianthus annuus]|nr:putative phosphoric monoester hydrolase [Helianthus annuus]